MKAGCKTNAGARVGVGVNARLRGDVPVYRLSCKVTNHKSRSVTKNGSGRYCKKGQLTIKTFGYKLRLRVTWHAPATTGYRSYTKTRTYRT